MSDDEVVIAAGAAGAGAHAMTQRGAVIGLELPIDEEHADG